MEVVQQTKKTYLYDSNCLVPWELIYMQTAEALLLHQWWNKQQQQANKSQQLQVLGNHE